MLRHTSRRKTDSGAHLWERLNQSYKAPYIYGSPDVIGGSVAHEVYAPEVKFESSGGYVSEASRDDDDDHDDEMTINYEYYVVDQEEMTALKHHNTVPVGHPGVPATPHRR